ncbi:MAG: MBL fold metallo-hydrolase [Chloroflexota bacterium]
MTFERWADADPATPAATVVLLRPARGPGDGAGELQVLLAHRPSTMAFAAGLHVFPGGRVDPADHDRRLAARSAISEIDAAIALGGDLDPGPALAAFIAAIRECFEEAGVLLADGPPGVTGPELDEARARLLAGTQSFTEVVEALDLDLRTDLLVPLSRWVTPPGPGRRYDARFFAAALPDDGAASLVGGEVVAQDWHTPRDALDAMAAGRLEMWPPTSVTLQQLEHAQSMVDIRARLTPRPLGDVVIESMGADIVRIQMPAGGGVAGQPVNAYLVGRTSLVLVDPGDPTGPALDAVTLVAAERGGRIEAVALTHVDPDHAGGAVAVADQLRIPIHASDRHARDVPYPIAAVADGAPLPAGDVPLVALATPGPTVDHVAVVVGDGEAVVSGDLDGPRGARSIHAPVDEKAWRASAARLRARAPGARWLPGHPSI